jgi:hypothetical protein
VLGVTISLTRVAKDHSGRERQLNAEYILYFEGRETRPEKWQAAF